MAVYEVTVQWLSRRKVTVMAANDAIAEDEAREAFEDEFFSERLGMPNSNDILISDVKEISP